MFYGGLFIIHLSKVLFTNYGNQITKPVVIRKILFLAKIFSSNQFESIYYKHIVDVPHFRLNKF